MDFSTIAETWVGAFDNIVSKSDYLAALTKNPVTLGHDIICIICASGQHRKGFRNTIINANANQWYTGASTQVPVAELLHNMKSRWDSIYFMINQLCAVHLAINSFLSLPCGPNDELSQHKLTPMEWEVLQDLEVVLEQCMLSESTPILGGAIPSFKTLMVQWEVLATNVPQCAPFINIGLEWAEMYYQHMGQTHAYVIAMCK
ncbi:hypothetical protein JVU11DRAFT_9467 [Chiua virens]|nr:hypothetical protein JVU11DRAFT_9467 [Chiua virens]